MAEREQPEHAGHQVQAERQHREDRGDEEEALVVARRVGHGPDAGQEGHDQGVGRERRAARAHHAAAARRRRASGGEGPPHAVGEEPRRRDDQDDQHDEEREPVRGLGVDVGVGEDGEHPEQQPAAHRRGGLLDPADHEGDEPRDAEGVAEVGVGEGEGADEDPGHTDEQPAEREGQHRVEGDVGPGRRGDLRVARDGDADLAERRALAHDLEGDDDDHRDEDRRDLLPGERARQDPDVTAAQHGREGQRRRAPDVGGERLQDDPHPQRRDQPREAHPVEAQDRPDGQEVDHDPADGGHGDPDDQGEGERHAVRGEDGDRHDRGHHELARREVDDPGDVVDDRVAHRHQAVDRPGGQSGEDHLEHSRPRVGAGIVRRYTALAPGTSRFPVGKGSGRPRGRVARGGSSPPAPRSWTRWSTSPW